MVDFPVRYEKNNQNGKVFPIILMARHGQTLIFSSQSSDFLSADPSAAARSSLPRQSEASCRFAEVWKMAICSTHDSEIFKGYKS